MNMKDETEKLAIDLCEIYGRKYHHFDYFAEPPYKDDKDLKNALLIIYSEQHGPWCLAVNGDGSVVWPGQDFLFKSNELFFKILVQMDKIDRLDHGG